MENSMKYFFETYGCQMNKAESASTEQKLIERGWVASPDAEDADFYHKYVFG